MGFEVEARCKCDLQATLMVGGSIEGYKTHNYFPVYCNTCKTISQANIREKSPRCSTCGATDIILYNDPSLIGKCGHMNVAQDFDLKLTSGTYWCPNCCETTLTFHRTAIID